MAAVLRSLLIFVPLALAACASTHGIAPQASLTPLDQLKAGKALAEATESPPWTDGRWWAVFADPQLDRLMDQAMQDSPSLKIAAARVRGAEAVVDNAHSALLPTLGGKADFERTKFSSHDVFPPPYGGAWWWYDSAGIKASYDLDLWGKNRDAWKGALDELQVGMADSRESELTLQTAVVRAYIQLTQEYVLADVAELTLKQRREVLDISRRRLNAGLGTQIEVAQAETQVPAAENQLEEAQDEIEILGLQLAALTGRGPGDAATITRPTLVLDHLPQLPETLPASWVGRRPDIVADRWAIEAQSEGIRVAQKAFYPDINLSASIGLVAFQINKLIGPDSITAAYGPAITLPIFTGGELRAKLGAQTARYDIAVETYNQAIIEAMRQVASGVTTVRSLDAQIATTSDAMQSANRAYQLALSGYRAGLTEYINVLSTQTAVFTEQQQLAILQGKRLNDYAGLVQAAGGGFEAQKLP